MPVLQMRNREPRWEVACPRPELGKRPRTARGPCPDPACLCALAAMQAAQLPGDVGTQHRPTQAVTGCAAWVSQGRAVAGQGTESLFSIRPLRGALWVVGPGELVRPEGPPLGGRR